jgi:type VI secretion system protein ImpF
VARTEIEHIVTPSLLDRLTDESPRLSIDTVMTRAESERSFRRSVERDVEHLLNTRRTMYPAPETLNEVRHSVYEYGLIDTTGIPVGTPGGRDSLLAALRDTIVRFEPRLAETRVMLVDADQASAPQLRFVVEAQLILDRERQQVVFDTVLEVASGEYDVKDKGAAGGGT